MDWLFNIDKTLIFAVQDNIVNPLLTPFMQGISFIGEYGAIWIILGIVLCCTKTYRQTGIAVLIGLLFTLLVGNIFLKHLVMRTRPCIDFAGISVLPVTPPANDYSFPSGHSFSSFVAATAIASTKIKGWIIAAFSTALIMAFSRIYLFVHYPSDVLTGMILGIVFGILACKISKFIYKRCIGIY